MPSENILVVEDEEDILELVVYNLTQEGYRVRAVTTGEQALEETEDELPDLIILDLMLPGVDGLDVCRILKRKKSTAHVPIVMLTARTEEPDIVTGLELGADDYITKPFSPKILVARARAVLRRRSQTLAGENDELTVHGITIRPGRHEVLVKGKAIELTATEFKILHFLARRAGWVFTRYQIVDAVHGKDHPVTDRSVDVQIVGLRKKLGQAGKYIETVRGIGYRFKE